MATTLWRSGMASPDIGQVFGLASFILIVFYSDSWSSGFFDSTSAAV